jgi:predicted ATPase
MGAARKESQTDLGLQEASLFVGRDAEIAFLGAALEDAIAGRGRVVLVAGEAGIGKTRTCEELSARARDRGPRVLWGRCYEGEGAPPFWPWVQILRSYVREDDPADVLAETGLVAGDVAQIIDDLRRLLCEEAGQVPQEPAEARFRLFDGVTTLFKNAARRRPLVLVLDDLHCADAPSLLLLRFLAREVGDSRLLVVGTYRDSEIAALHPLAATLGELVRQSHFRALFLKGLELESVRRLIEATAGGLPSIDLVGRVEQQAGGNPLFIGEIVRLLVAEGRLAGIHSIRAAIGVPSFHRAYGK